MCDRTTLHTKTSLKMTRDYAKVLPGFVVEALIMERFRQVSNPEDYLGLLDFCDIAALPKNYVLIRIRIANFGIS